MKLSVLERILLLNALPSEGSLTTIMIIRELRESLSFSEDDHKILKFRDEPNGSIKWSEGVIEKEVEIAGKALEIAKETMTRLEKEEKLNVGHISLYTKIVGDK